MPCPRIIRGPATAPRRELSVTVMVKSGPGIKAPDKAMINDEKKMAIRLSVMRIFLKVGSKVILFV